MAMTPLSSGISRLGCRSIGKQFVRGLNTNVATGRQRFFRVSEEVEDALATGKPVVALETTIYTHGRQ
jgi:pseudouridylate synthase / pseudouridine kinase